MPDDPRQALRLRLDGGLPDRLWALPDDQVADLESALTEAHERQSVALDGSIEKALDYLPWLLRGVVRRVLLG